MIRVQKVRMSDRRSGGDRRKCTMWVEDDRREGDRRVGEDRRQGSYFQQIRAKKRELVSVH